MFLTASSYKVICIGSTSKDIFFPTDEGVIIETPEDITSKEKIAFELGGKYRVANRYEAVGGVAANVSHGLVKLGHNTACYSRIGRDEVGDWIMNKFRSAHVPTKFLFVDESAKTDLSAIVVLTQNGERTIFHNPDANEKLEIIDEKLERAEWFFVSALNGDWQGNLKKILALKNKMHCLLAFNPGQHNIKSDTQAVLEGIAESDVLLLNKDEAIELVLNMKKDLPREHLDNEMFLLETLHRLGAKIISMTDGKRGAWSFDGKEYWYCPIFTRGDIVDSTGCGDSFASGFFSALLEGQSIEKALRYGILNSGSVIGHYGAIAGLLSKSEMSDMIEKVHPERLN